MFASALQAASTIICPRHFRAEDVLPRARVLKLKQDLTATLATSPVRVDTKRTSAARVLPSKSRIHQLGG